MGVVRKGESEVMPTLLFGETGWMLGIHPDDEEMLEEGADHQVTQEAGALDWPSAFYPGTPSRRHGLGCQWGEGWLLLP